MLISRASVLCTVGERPRKHSQGLKSFFSLLFLFGLDQPHFYNLTLLLIYNYEHRLQSTKGKNTSLCSPLGVKVLHSCCTERIRLSIIDQTESEIEKSVTVFCDCDYSKHG